MVRECDVDGTALAHTVCAGEVPPDGPGERNGMAIELLVVQVSP
jgi:hypothetical protein